MKSDLQSIRLILLLLISGRQRSKGRFPLLYLITFVNKIRDPAAIFLADTLFGIRNRGSWKQNSLKYIRNGKDRTSETKKEEEQRL